MKCKLTILFFILVFSLNAQTDWRIAKNTTSLEFVEQVQLPKQNNDQLLQEEMNRRGPGVAPKFAVNVPVNITPDSHGTWEFTASNKAVWRLRIYSKNAKSLNLGFTKYFMPPGGIMTIYSTDYEMITGPFSPADNEVHEQLWTPVFHAEELVVEIQLPMENQEDLEIELTSINHDFLGFGSVISGSCNVDVICGEADGFPEIEEHRDIIQSVAVIGFNGGTFCTGFLINNAEQDCKPYFMTADHCGITSGNASSLVAYWNFQNSTCREPGSTASGQAGDGSLSDFNTGAIFRSGSGTSDFTLTELDDPINESAEAFLAGWNNGDSPPTSAIAVHHPSTDEKRISFEDDPLMMTNGFGSSPSSNFTHVRVVDWDLGTTEPGSSGSPLFDQNERVVGQLHGGGAACGNNQSDWYGAIARSWSGNGSSATRLSDWLDPNDSGVEQIDGIEASFCTFSVDAVENTVESCPDGTAIFALIPSLNFNGDVQLTVSGVPASADFMLSVNPVTPGDTSYLTLTNLDMLTVDNYFINVEGSDGTNTSNEMVTLALIDTPGATTLSNPSDGAMNISTSPTFVWQAVPTASEYYIEVATDDAFTNIVKEATVSSIAYSTSGLEIGTVYYWRVNTMNICGDALSATSSFTTSLDLAVSINPTTIAICNSESATYGITLGSSFSSAGAALTASGVPPGGTISYGQNPAFPDMPTSIVIDNLAGAPSGNYSIAITADDGTNSNTKNINLILEAPPAPAQLNTPMDNATEVDLQPQFLWIPSDNANEYLLEIATDIDFNNVVASTTTNITVHSLTSDLEQNTIHYWRVSAEGDCGGSQSLVRSFTTILIDDVSELSDALVDIRPNPTSGIVSISLSNPLPGSLNIELYSINGQKLLAQNNSGQISMELSLEDYPSGVYLLRLVNDQNILTKKIVLQK